MLSISAVSASAIKNNAKSEVRHPNFARGGTAQSVALAGWFWKKPDVTQINFYYKLLQVSKLVRMVEPFTNSREDRTCSLLCPVAFIHRSGLRVAVKHSIQLRRKPLGRRNMKITEIMNERKMHDGAVWGSGTRAKCWQSKVYGLTR